MGRHNLDKSDCGSWVLKGDEGQDMQAFASGYWQRLPQRSPPNRILASFSSL